jgi:histone H3/H4
MTEDADQKVAEALSALKDSLGKKRGPKDFSEFAVRELANQYAGFLKDIGLNAISLARRNSSDFVSESDVRVAGAVLRSKSNLLTRLLEPVGGLFAGAGLEQLLIALSATHIERVQTSLSITFTIIGIALLITALARR